MPTYTLTFRIAEERVGNLTYQDRYQALMEQIRIHASQWWIEPTSYIAFSSSATIDVLAAACRDSIDPTHDMFLLAAVTVLSARICGKNDDPDIYKLLPHLKEVR